MPSHYGFLRPAGYSFGRFFGARNTAGQLDRLEADIAILNEAAGGDRPMQPAQYARELSALYAKHDVDQGEGFRNDVATQQGIFDAAFGKTAFPDRPVFDPGVYRQVGQPDFGPEYAGRGRAAETLRGRGLTEEGAQEYRGLTALNRQVYQEGLERQARDIAFNERQAQLRDIARYLGPKATLGWIQQREAAAQAAAQAAAEEGGRERRSVRQARAQERVAELNRETRLDIQDMVNQTTKSEGEKNRANKILQERIKGLYARLNRKPTLLEQKIALLEAAEKAGLISFATTADRFAALGIIEVPVVYRDVIRTLMADDDFWELDFEEKAERIRQIDASVGLGSISRYDWTGLLDAGEESTPATPFSEVGTDY